MRWTGKRRWCDVQTACSFLRYEKGLQVFFLPDLRGESTEAHDLYVPSNLERGRALSAMVARSAGSSLVYSALLLGLFSVGSAATNAEGIAHLEKNAQAPGVKVLPSGLQYRVIRPSPTPDGPTPAVNSPCVCHYHGSLIDGTVFDSSVKRGSPLTFAPNQVIKGWTEALQMMHEGDKWELTVPSDLAYGARGSPPKIPGGAVLVFELELITVKEASAWSLFGIDLANPQLLFAAAMLVFYAYKTFGAGGGGANGPKISLDEAMKSPGNPTVYFDMQVRLPGKGNSNSHGARPVHLIITMVKWIRTSRLSMNSLSICRLARRTRGASRWCFSRSTSPRR